jgi:hypothetical protein
MGPQADVGDGSVTVFRWRQAVLCKPLLPELYEPVLTSIGNGLMVLRAFEREGEAATVQEWRCECGRCG